MISYFKKNEERKTTIVSGKKKTNKVKFGY